MHNKEIDRRTFIKQTIGGVSLTAVGGVLPSFNAKSYARILGANARISVAVVGVNSRGRALAINFAHQANCRISHIADVDSRAIDKCIAAVAKIQDDVPRGEADFRQLLDNREVDALVMAPPDH